LGQCDTGSRFSRYRTWECVLPYSHAYNDCRAVEASAQTCHLLRDEFDALDSSAADVWYCAVRLSALVFAGCWQQAFIDRAVLKRSHTASQRRVLQRVMVSLVYVRTKASMCKHVESLIKLMQNGTEDSLARDSRKGSTATLPRSTISRQDGDDAVLAVPVGMQRHERVR
jgi:hypothetical protein